MSTTPDGEYKWILHIVDHSSKSSSSFALSKHAVKVAEKLALWIGSFGPPHVLRCDNGTEFKDTATKPQKRRTSQHRKRRNRRDEDAIRAWGSKNVNSRTIPFRLHAQVNYNNNNQGSCTFIPKKHVIKGLNGQLEPRHLQTHSTLKRKLQHGFKILVAPSLVMASQN